MEYLPLVLGTAGVTFFITDSLLFERPRLWAAQRSAFLQKLLSCPFCTGVWVAVFLSLLQGVSKLWPELTWALHAPAKIFGAAFVAMFLIDFMSSENDVIDLKDLEGDDDAGPD